MTGQIKEAVCSELDILFVNLDDIRGAEDYMAGMNTVIYGDGGAEHIIEHDGVARRPGGMKIIAERVLALVEQKP